jgi:O-antigen ligase
MTGQPHQSFLLYTAVIAPGLLAHNLSPSTTQLNQVLAAGIWCTWVAGSALAMVQSVGARLPNARQRLDAHGGIRWVGAPRALALSFITLCLLIASALASAALAGAAPSLVAASSATLAVAALLLLASHRAAASPATSTPLFQTFTLAWLLCGAFNSAIALIQVFAPSIPDGTFIAHSSLPGRAVGNLRQPNHLSSLLLWSLIAVAGALELRLLGPRGSRRAVGIAAGLMALMTFAVVLTASRTGLIGVLLLAVWGLVDRRLSRPVRLLLLATPLIYAAGWAAMAGWAQATDHTFGGQQRLSEGSLSSSRFAIWANTVELIRMHPWTGVGWGEFNFAWTLTPFPGRPTAFFDHTHNLPLHLAVELGIPLATLILALLGWGLWAAWRRSLAATGDASTAGRCAVMMLLLIGLHSLLEYPLWYAYFLLPTAWVWGYALGIPVAQTGVTSPATAPAPRPQDLAHPPDQPLGSLASSANPWPARALAAGGALAVAGSVFAVWDYFRVTPIFSADSTLPLEQRIETGKRSVFSAHHAHYAAATVAERPSEAMDSFHVATHALLDTRLMMAWARAYAELGDLDRARHIADRLREFRNPASEAFFAECDDARKADPPRPLPFQCTPPSRALTWQDFLPGRDGWRPAPSR